MLTKVAITQLSFVYCNSLVQLVCIPLGSFLVAVVFTTLYCTLREPINGCNPIEPYIDYYVELCMSTVVLYFPIVIRMEEGWKCIL